MSENIVSANEKYAEHLGKDYAGSSNMAQAAFLNGWFGNLRYVCQGQTEDQLAYIWMELTPEAKKQIAALGAFAEFD